nr:RHS repeat protein [Moritella viscosa]
MSEIEYPYVTKSMWRLSCYISELTNLEGFKATAPNGDTYYFDIISNHPGYRYKTRTIHVMDYEDQHEPEKVSIALMVSKIEDKFGNWVKYEYEDFDDYKLYRFKSVNNRALLTRIHSNDEREITITSVLSKRTIETTVNSSGNIWKYGNIWKSQNDNGHYYVEQPDGKRWKYDLEVSAAEGEFDLRGVPRCRPWLSAGDNKIIVESPDGVTGIFDFDFIRTDRSNIQVSEGNPDRYVIQHKRCGHTFALQKKTLSLAGENYEWNYNYSQNLGQFQGEEPKEQSLLKGTLPDSISPVDHRTVSILKPDLSLITYYINRDSQSYMEGGVTAIKYQENRSGSLYTNLIERYKYKKGPFLGKTAGWTATRLSYQNFESYSIPKILTEIISTSVSDEGEDNYITSFHNYNQFGKPQLMVERNDFSNNYKRTKTEFLNDTNRWILNLPTKTFISNNDNIYKLETEISYYSDSFLPYKKSSFGRLATTHIYHHDGNIKKNIYNGSNRYEIFDDYYRGKARKTTVPCATINDCNTVNGSTANTMVTKIEINGDGTTKSVTDFKGQKINYSYNPVGWLTKVDYSNNYWADKVISYSNVTIANDALADNGISVGQLKQKITQGNFEKVIYRDGRLRPTLTRIQDKASSSTTTYQRALYDYDNRPTLLSFPSDHASIATGMVIKYDAIGRIVSTIRQSDGARSTIEYLRGNKVRITDAKGNITNTTFLAYGSPSYDMPTVINSPDSSDTLITYNKFDQVTSIIQGGVTERRLYDSYQQLCKIYRPETGVTAYGYNAQRRLTWIAEGTNGGSENCAAMSVPASHKVLLSYDNRDQLRTRNYPDSTPDNTYSYDANGNLTRLESGIGLGAVNWNYQYNSLNLIERESLSVKGENFILDWGYNSLGAVSWLTYPSGKTIHYAPNALGQATKASEGIINYASNIKYHPNGEIKQLTYGNGIVRNVVLDTTGRVDAISDGKMGDYQLHLDASYDDNDNLSSLVDWVDHSNDIDNISYDGLNRLKTADGKWGSGSYNYDDAGNILSRSISGSVINYNYNSANQLINIRGAYSYNYAYDARGNVINNGRYSLAFNRANQMSSAKEITYVYDGNNRRVAQIKANGINYSVYSQKGLLLHRRKTSGDKVDSVYVGKQLIANIERR